MGFALTEYVKIKDNYCICYFGHQTAYLVQLRILRPFIEQALPKLRLYICCNDEYLYLFEDEPRIVAHSQIDKKQFAFIRELVANKDHVIENLLKESDIAIPALPQTNKDGVCLILPEGIPPVKSVSVQMLEKYARLRGLEPIVVGSDVNASMQSIVYRPKGEERLRLAKQAKIAIGVECDLLYLTGFYGGRTVLMSNSCGLDFYRKLFPDGNICS